MFKDKTIEYALGVADAETTQTVKTEITQSPNAIEDLTMIENTLGSIAKSGNQYQPSMGLKNRLLNSLSTNTRFDGFLDRLCDFLDLDTNTIDELLNNINHAPETPWLTTGLPGVWTLPFQGGKRIASTECSLMYMEPKHCFPKHSHLGDEWGFILQGRVEEDSGKIYNPGDIVHKESGEEHLLRVTSNEPFVFAVVLHGKIELIDK